MKHFENNDRGNVISLSRAHRSQAQTKVSQLVAFKKIWDFLAILFTKKRELQVRFQTDQFGYSWWNVYSSTTGTSVRFWSHAEMLAWIEDYYSR